MVSRSDSNATRSWRRQQPSVDVLMITRAHAESTRLALRSLLATAGCHLGVWLWHHGACEETLAVVEASLGHPAVRDFHHHQRVSRATDDEPLGWFWRHASGDFLGRVSARSLLPADWAHRIVAIHQREPLLGVLACWPFLEADFMPEVVGRKLLDFESGAQVLPSPRIGGSAYLMKRNCLFGRGMPRDHESFDAYCQRLARDGWLHGWPFPFVTEQRLDDPSCSASCVHTDRDLLGCVPPTPDWPRASGVDDWARQWRLWARRVQYESGNPRRSVGWRSWPKRLARLVRRRGS